ncbi:tryptophan tryptophylquinone biosynthesis enzyme MauG [Thauera humireducens]|uniref:tryptophan tryptophylquinone biosynthesis enzyme MauG n=1 Tax=Thauera humireducens TaxID=1134435 RepID=UPI000A9B9ECF|nr:tryptophan tryptophylquinone biosynthesis enzyme MauG [Thauera humireducens]
METASRVLSSAAPRALRAFALGLSVSLVCVPAAAMDGGGRSDYRRPDSPPAPGGQPPSAAQIELGRTLFFDPRLSRDATMSCATCHAPELRWSDGRVRPIGSEQVVHARRTPTVVNSAWLSALMWDGRAASLEAQAALPITSPHEMGQAMPALVERLSGIAGYRRLFGQAYGDEVVSERRVAEALASFQRTLVSPVAPFDRWVAGEDDAIDAQARAGFRVFTGKARCVACHKGWRFTDDSFHDIGLDSTDPGRGAHVPAEVVIMQHAFKTPSLRDLAVEGPYMHDGSMHSLEEVIRHYEKGGRQRPSLSPEMKSFELDPHERAALIAFLRTLDGGFVRVDPPVLPE